MHHTSFGMLLCLWLELAYLLAPATASPSFRFVKGSPDHHSVEPASASPFPANSSAAGDHHSDVPIDAAKYVSGHVLSFHELTPIS
jgi:hypothetical protein